MIPETVNLAFSCTNRQSM